jgi:uncharacterized protein (TIGR03000 family)
MLRTPIRLIALAALTLGLTFLSGNQATAAPHHGGGGNWSGGNWSGGHWSGGGWSGGWNGNWGGSYGGYRYYYPRSYGYGFYPSYSYPYDSYPYDYYYNYPSRRYVEPSTVVDSSPGKVTVLVPDTAEVWFNDKVTRGPAQRRWFESPGLSGNEDFSVTIRASWMEDGAKVERTRTVDLHAGDNMKLDFRAQGAPGGSGSGTSEKIPQPGK